MNINRNPFLTSACHEDPILITTTGYHNDALFFINKYNNERTLRILIRWENLICQIYCLNYYGIWQMFIIFLSIVFGGKWKYLMSLSFFSIHQLYYRLGNTLLYVRHQVSKFKSKPRIKFKFAAFWNFTVILPRNLL